jgi:CRP-like cAMP-binding protein
VSTQICSTRTAKLRLAVYGDGDFFGETPSQRPAPYHQPQTLTPSVFMTLERACFRGLLEGSPELRTSFEALVRQREEGARNLRAATTHGPVEPQIAPMGEYAALLGRGRQTDERYRPIPLSNVSRLSL